MGHLYRALNFAECLEENGEDYMILINADSAATEVLSQRGVPFETVDLDGAGWEAPVIKRLGVTVWINDRLDTDEAHARRVRDAGVKLVTFDDRGGGAAYSDLNIAALYFGKEEKLEGETLVTGIDYLVLNSEIAGKRRLRKNAGRIIVSLGGSDTYGVTVKAVHILKKLGKGATVHTGPSFAHRKELEAACEGGSFEMMGSVPSLIDAFYEFDLAITGGGITPFEANASGLPCIVIANEIFEIENGRFLESAGSSVFAGYHTELDESVFARDLPIERMSEAGMRRITLDGASNVYERIKAL